MRRLSPALCLCLLTVGSAPSAQTGQVRRSGQPPAPVAVDSVPDARIDRLSHWLKAVARHAPGEDDDALADVVGLSNANLKELWIDANVLIQVMRGSKADRFNVRGASQKTSTQTLYTKTQLHRLRALACAASGALVETACMAMGAGDELDPELRQLAALARKAKLRGDDNYILRRGALLHGDVPVIAPLAMSAEIEPRAVAGPERFRIEISDGREIELRQSAVHWEMARMLLDFVGPRGSDRADPGGDDMVRQWYRATAAWMQLRQVHDKFHLDRARELFPADPDILFLAGCQRETFAGPAIQAAVRSAVLPTGVTIDVESGRGELRQAETLFRRALEIKPDHMEARLHFGRVLALLGRPADAAVELRRAVVELRETQLLYYAQLFLGSEEEALGNREAARAAYEHAAELSPTAQSPLLALSQLARRHGDRPAALRAMERLFTIPGGDPSEHDDPWWSYYVFQARDAGELLEALRQPFLAERLP